MIMNKVDLRELIAQVGPFVIAQWCADVAYAQADGIASPERIRAWKSAGKIFDRAARDIEARSLDVTLGYRPEPTDR